MNSKSNFCKLSTHTKKRWNPHPENSTRTTNGNSTCNTCNITRTYSCRKSSTNSLKWCNGTITCFLLFKHTPIVVLMAYGNFLICKKLVLILKYKPTPIIQIIAGTPQIKLLTAELIFSIVSNILTSLKCVSDFVNANTLIW